MISGGIQIEKRTCTESCSGSRACLIGQALKHFYYDLGDKIWGEYGFYDAFREQENWYPPRYLAIDQGPIIVMIENYRSALLWKLFMSCPEVRDGLKKLGFAPAN